MGRSKKKTQNKTIKLGEHNDSKEEKKPENVEDAEILKAQELEAQKQKKSETQKEKNQPEKQPEFKFDFGSGKPSQANQGFNFDFGNANENPLFQLSEADRAQFIQMVGQQMSSLIGKSSGYFENLPKPIQNRISALKKLQEEQEEIDKEYQQELALLQKKYHDKFSPFYDKRADIVSGKIEPTPEESGERIVEISEEEETKEKAEEKETEEETKGIPEFWLQALRHHEEFGEIITERDEEALQYLKDIRWEPYEDSLHSFTLEFYFDENPFFENTVLKKTYFLMESIGGEVKFDHTDCTEIKWKSGKNLTFEKKEKKRGKKGKGKGQKKPQQEVIVVEEPCPSFFNFFNPEALLELEDFKESEYSPEEALEAILEGDYELGCELKEKIIPNAILWYTGEASFEDLGEYDEDFGFDDEEDFDEESDEEDEDHDFQAAEQGQTQEAPECKQQQDEE